MKYLYFYRDDLPTNLEKKNIAERLAKPLAKNALLKTVNSVSRDSQWKTLRFEENKLNCFRRDQSLYILSDLLYSWKL